MVKPTELKWKRLVRSCHAYFRAVPRIKHLSYSSPEQKVALLREEGIAVHEMDVIHEELEAFRAICDYSTYYLGTPEDDGFRGKAYQEKSLEHFLSFKLLDLKDDDTLIDIASADSNFAENVGRLGGCAVFRQDILFPEGLHGNTIGGDAGSLPLPDNFATAVTLHCSLEHFEGDADVRFIHEAGRVLAPGGRFCILPVYIERFHLHMTEPDLWRPDIPLDPGARWYFPRRGTWNNRFGRFYSPAAFRERIMSNLEPFDWKLIWFRNRQELYPDLWCDFALVGRLK